MFIAQLQAFLEAVYYPQAHCSEGTDVSVAFIISFLTTYMNKQDVAEKVQTVIGSTKADAERAVEAVIDAIIGGLKKGEDVAIAGLGIFKVKPRAARVARNPRTGEAVNVPATRVPKFQAAKALKDAVAK